MRKLPVLAAFTHALKSTKRNLPFAFHASWPWLLFLIPFNLYTNASFAYFDPTSMDPVKQAEIAKAMLIFYLTSTISMIIYASIGVTWHRYILQDVVPQGLARLRMDKTILRYVGNTLLIGIFALFSILPLAMLAGIILQIVGAPSNTVIPVYMSLAVMIALPVTYRFSLKLPAIAVANDHFRFGDAWNVTRGNMLQLVMLGVLVFAAMSAVGFGLNALESAVQWAAGQSALVLFDILRQLASWIVAIFTITMLTSLYGFFVENRDF
jgi:hypothetical protein